MRRSWSGRRGRKKGPMKITIREAVDAINADTARRAPAWREARRDDFVPTDAQCARKVFHGRKRAMEGVSQGVLPSVTMRSADLPPVTRVSFLFS